MNIEKHIIDTAKFYLNLIDNIKNQQNKQYIINIFLEILLDKNGHSFLLKTPKLLFVLKKKCEEFLNNQLALQWFKEKMKFYDNIISELELLYNQKENEKKSVM